MPAKKTVVLTADDDVQLLRMVARKLELEGKEIVSRRSTTQGAPFFVSRLRRRSPQTRADCERGRLR